MENSSSSTITPTNPYLEKFGFCAPQLTTPPVEGTAIFVVIPCFDEPNLISSLQSLANCTPPTCNVEVITVINASQKASRETIAQNEKTHREALEFSQTVNQDHIQFRFIVQQQLPPKHAGVGLARKIGMDEAITRKDLLGLDDALLVCFDADSSCSKDYLVKIEAAFKQYPKAGGASIHFEHPLSGADFDSAIYQAISDYELHLRYYKNAFEFTGHPFACYTIGSSMAVRASAYQMQGGMNKRKAGEDFYFLQKIIENHPLIEINDTKVIPSPRPSHRVPFGTGRAISEHLEGATLDSTYDLRSFVDVKSFLMIVDRVYDEGNLNDLMHQKDLPVSIQSFLNDQDFPNRIPDLIQYGTKKDTFLKRFFNWFNAFRVLKFVHYSRDHFYPNVSLKHAIAQWFLATSNPPFDEPSNTELLHFFRIYDTKKGNILRR